MDDFDASLTVHYGGLTFSGGDGRDGFYIEPGGFSGWEDGVGSDVDTAPRPSGGRMDVAPRLSDRLVTIRGLCWAPHPQALRERGQRLAGLGADGVRRPVLVEQYGSSMWAWGRRAPNAPKFDSAPALGFAEYQLSIWLPNPRRYGETRRTLPAAANVQRTFENRGNLAATGKFTVQGPQPSGYSIVAPGQPTFQVPSQLVAGSTDVVDMATGVVMRNGQPLIGVVVAPRVWSVPAAGVQTWSGALTGSGTITGEITDTYV